MGFYAKHVFPLLEEMLATPEQRQLRRDALQHVEGRVLEVGLGAASNLPFYPASVKQLTAVEPADSPRSRWGRKRIEAWAGELDLVSDRGENLPFGSGEFDTVVTSFVLCSVADVPMVLSEVRRVLRPGGRYVFLEHVASSDRAVRARQDRVARAGLWYRMTCGCAPNRETQAAISRAGFEIDALTEAPIIPARPDPVVRYVYKLCPAIYGSATNPA